MTSEVVGSVIVPAYMEGRVIDRCLHALLDGPTPLEVVVVVNGSDDDTAARAREHIGTGRHLVTVLELAEGGKAGALNAGDEVATAFPRMYLDADVTCPHAAAVAVLRELGGSGPLAAAPRLTYDLTGCPWPVAAYTRVWTALHRTPSIIGSGVYAVSEEGRRRFDRFPDGIADDAYVRSLFAVDECAALDLAFIVYPPRRTWDLVRRKTRVFLGLLELAEGGHEPEFEHNTSPIGLLRRRDRPPLGEIVVYVLVTLVAKVRAASQLRRGRTDVWERDESSRAVTD